MIVKILIGTLWMLVILMLLLFLATLPRVRILLQKEDALHLWIRYGPIRIHAYPLPAWMQSKLSASSQSQDASSSSNASIPNRNQLDYGEIICIFLDFFDAMRDMLRIDIVRLKLLIATGDAARTGILLGECAALLGIITPFFQQNFQIKDYHIDVDGDFQGEHTIWSASFCCSVRPIALIWMLIQQRDSLKQLYHVLTNSGGETHE